MAHERDKRDDRDRDREGGIGEGVGGLVDELAGSWLFGDALTRIVDAGERVMHAQQNAISALGLPSGSQFESLTLRVRTLFHRIEELEDDLDRLDRRLSSLESAARERKPAEQSAAEQSAAEQPRSAQPKRAPRAAKSTARAAKKNS